MFSVLDSELPRQLDLFPFSSRVHYKNRSSTSRAGRVGVLFTPLCGIGNFATGRKGMGRVDDISGRLIERASKHTREKERKTLLASERFCVLHTLLRSCDVFVLEEMVMIWNMGIDDENGAWDMEGKIGKERSGG